MRLILSRKGFDSSEGGVPSPVLPDGRMLSLPIPSEVSPIRYSDIVWEGRSMGPVVSQLTGGRYGPDDFAHLDPDLRPDALPRIPGWLPLFGQARGAQGHLRNQGVGEGDIFLFFGLFQRVGEGSEGLEWDHSCRPFHALWGWMQIGEVASADASAFSSREWAAYHPHLNCRPMSNNVLYVARDFLSLDGVPRGTVPGAGVFARYSPKLRLTAVGSSSASLWELPGWFFPAGCKTPLSYHGKPDRWRRADGKAILKSAARGQEFVLDCGEYPEATGWLAALLPG